MKLLKIVMLLLTALAGQAQQPSRQVLEQMLPDYFQKLNTAIQILGHESDSTSWPEVQASILRLYFTTDTIQVPDLLVPEDSYLQKRPKIAVHVLLSRIPYYFWKGFQFEIHTKDATVQEMSENDTSIKAIVLVPVGLRGIARQERRLQRIGEVMKITLEGQWVDYSIKDCKISNIQGTGEWLYGAPLTRSRALEIENQLLTPLKRIFSATTSDSLRHKACEELKSRLKKDTIFFVSTDKVSTPYSINECKFPGEVMIDDSRKLEIAEFSLDYTTDFYRGANQVFIGQRTRLDNVNLKTAVGAWYKTLKKDWVPVEDSVAVSKKYEWKVSDLIIHF
ncbi:hypothetical protein [Telluribacter humicola]|uniref:hypothetical protein n=1 Tax=Telluribacter humicola TaxID=1720261 RepID=UPI001A9564B1|nr:hypothetical protein [Telluribacter humicola]